MLNEFLISWYWNLCYYFEMTGNKALPALLLPSLFMTIKNQYCCRGYTYSFSWWFYLIKCVCAYESKALKQAYWYILWLNVLSMSTTRVQYTFAAYKAHPKFRMKYIGKNQKRNFLKSVSGLIGRDRSQPIKCSEYKFTFIYFISPYKYLYVSF